MQGLDELMTGRTVVVIAHRLSTLRKADRIYVIQEGQVVEHGKHSELIEGGGLYATLDRLQHGGHRNDLIELSTNSQKPSDTASSNPLGKKPAAKIRGRYGLLATGPNLQHELTAQAGVTK